MKVTVITTQALLAAESYLPIPCVLDITFVGCAVFSTFYKQTYCKSCLVYVTRNAFSNTGGTIFMHSIQHVGRRSGWWVYTALDCRDQDLS